MSTITTYEVFILSTCNLLSLDFIWNNWKPYHDHAPLLVLLLLLLVLLVLLFSLSSYWCSSSLVFNDDSSNEFLLLPPGVLLRISVTILEHWIPYWSSKIILVMISPLFFLLVLFRTRVGEYLDTWWRLLVDDGGNSSCFVSSLDSITGPYFHWLDEGRNS